MSDANAPNPVESFAAALRNARLVVVMATSGVRDFPRGGLPGKQGTADLCEWLYNVRRTGGGPFRETIVPMLAMVGIGVDEAPPPAPAPPEEGAMALDS